MCRHLLRAGFHLSVHDLDRTAVKAMAGEGARGAATPRELASLNDVIIVMVTDDTAVREVVAGEDGLLQGAPPGLVIAISSSVHPDTCRSLATMGHSRGVGVIDAPVARGLRGAEAGDLTIFAGGHREDVEKCRPVFEAFAPRIFYMGEIGAGQVTKTCNNLLHWSSVAAAYETLQLGARLGIAPGALREAMLAGSADSRTLRELHLVGMFWPQKDIDTAIELAESVQMELPLTEQVAKMVTKFSSKDLRALFDA